MAIEKKIDLEEAITSVQMPDGEESIEVEIDGKSVAKEAKVIKLLFHPEMDEGKYKSDAQRKAIYATKAEKEKNEDAKINWEANHSKYKKTTNETN